MLSVLVISDNIRERPLRYFAKNDVNRRSLKPDARARGSENVDAASVRMSESQQFPVSFQRASIGSSCIVDHGRQIAIEPMKWTS